MIVFFAFFYTHNVSFKVDDVADNLKIKTALSLVFAQAKDCRTSRIRGEPRACFGVCIPCGRMFIAEILRGQLGIPFYFGGTSLLIVVSVTMDTIQQVQSSLGASVQSDTEIAAA